MRRQSTYLGSIEIAVAVGITLFVVLIVSSTIGVILPIIGSKGGVDPAVFSAHYYDNEYCSINALL